MAASAKGCDLNPAIDLLTQPLLLETLLAIRDGNTLDDAGPADSDAVALHAAMQRLTTIGVVHPAAAGSFGRRTLTARGAHLIKLLEDLDALIREPQEAIAAQSPTMVPLRRAT